MICFSPWNLEGRTKLLPYLTKPKRRNLFQESCSAITHFSVSYIIIAADHIRQHLSPLASPYLELDGIKPEIKMNTSNESSIWKVIVSLEDYMPSGQSLIYLAIAVVLSNIALLVLTKSQKEVLYARVSSWAPAVARGRRISSANTPPRSLTPEKKVPNNAPPPADYKDIFPPSSREALLKLAESLSTSQKKKIGVQEVNQEEFTKNIVPFEADYRECGPSTYTPMEISMAEIKALGDFPDYSKLSGVPLPEAYKKFEIEKALPRPYRPFRWAYHQTMCMISLQ